MKVSFIDEADIVVASGSGGGGSIHFHRARFLPKGGPDGGDGGRGGDVIVFARENLSDLSAYLHKKSFRAESGAPGGGNKQHGKDGADLRLAVPVGTQVFDAETEEMLADLDTPGAEVVVARGGKGGKGNVHYKTPVRQAPRIAQKGIPGRRVSLRLVYKMITDIAVVGPANAGKSLFLSRITSAKPKVAPYPFTTRVPQLGVYFTEHEEPVTFVEIPALGMAPERRFLKHAERARILLYFLDASRIVNEADLFREWTSFFDWVRAHGHGLTEKAGVLVLNKVDIAEAGKETEALASKLHERTGMSVYPISAQTGRGVENLLKVLADSCKLDMP